ncbi:hypothetical protein KQX54_007315 [Cotesia glomerata]|uniref:Uncharacterized protein n=1 Tax=Cotesia glomerata TaxID=32391 RepID=A0AAV7IFB0_COTGL|nr:hypothetical protein KQX54_007315 [Cotesia glomerata]
MNRGGNHYDPKRPLGIDDQFIELIITVVREGYFNYSEFRLRGPPNMASLLEFKAAIVGYSHPSGRILPKEVACVTTKDDKVIEHWIVSPPIPFSSLEASTQQHYQIVELTHGLNWEKPGVSL